MNDRHLISEHYKLVTELTDSKANVARLVKKYGVSEDDAHELIHRFTKVEALLQNSMSKDIFSYPSLDKLEQTLTELENTQNNKQQLKRDAELGAKVVFESDKIIVRLIRNKLASVKFGRGTTWCTAVDDYDIEQYKYEDPENEDEDGNRFNSYAVNIYSAKNTVYYLELKDKFNNTSMSKVAFLINDKNERST